MIYGSITAQATKNFLLPCSPTKTSSALPACVLQVTRLTSPVAAMEYKAFVGLPSNDDIRDMLPPDARGPDAGMVFFALTNPQPDQPSPGSISLYCLKDWAGTMYLPEGAWVVRGLMVRPEVLSRRPLLVNPGSTTVILMQCKHNPPLSSHPGGGKKKLC
jgi:hypothetical protein